MLADGDLRAGACLDQRRAGQMVGVDMGFEHPFDRDAFLLGRVEQLLDRTVVDRPAGDVEIEHRVDRHAAAAIPDPRRDS